MIKGGKQEKQVDGEANVEELARRAQWQTKVWMSSPVTKPNIGNKWKTCSCPMAHAQVEFAAQTTVHTVRTVRVAQCCAHIMAMKTRKIHIQLAT